MKKILSLSILTFIISFAFSQENTDEKDCTPNVISYRLSEVKIKNYDALLMILDSVSARIREEDVSGFNLPYQKLIFIDKMDENIFKLTVRSKSVFSSVLETDYALIHNQHIFILRHIIEGKDKDFSNYFEATSNVIDYKFYSFDKLDKGYVCLIEPLITQEIVYYIKGNKYHFEMDCIKRIDMSFFYD